MIAVGFYDRHILPRVIDRACGSAALVPWRARALEGLRGRVVEIGFGTGHNLSLMGDAVTDLLAVEPSSVAWARSKKRRQDCGFPVTLAGFDGTRLDIEDGSCDGAISTFTLCTVPDPVEALSEIRRVLRPDGRVHLLEHGFATDERVRRWQRRLDPLERCLAGGCHLTRDPLSLARQAGFDVSGLDQGFGPGPRPWMWLTVGTAPRLGEAPSAQTLNAPL